MINAKEAREMANKVMAEKEKKISEAIAYYVDCQIGHRIECEAARGNTEFTGEDWEKHLNEMFHCDDAVIRLKKEIESFGFTCITKVYDPGTEDKRMLAKFTVKW